MEGRLVVPGLRAHRGVALLALAFIGVVTASWWALALYPAGATAPPWLLRTRLACFGAMPGGLPNAGGWILLVATPLSFVAVLVTVWGEALQRDWREAMHSWWGRVVAVATVLAVLWGAGWTVRTVTAFAASAASPASRTADAGVRVQPAPRLLLTDQSGAMFDVHATATPVLLTFAYAHCETVCPVTVQQLRAVRDALGPNVPMVIVTLDPWRDTPARLPSIATRWSLAAGDRVLSGSVDAVTSTLGRWSVAYARDPATGMIAHVAPVMVVAPRGRAMVRFAGVPRALRDALASLAAAAPPGS